MSNRIGIYLGADLGCGEERLTTRTREILATFTEDYGVYRAADILSDWKATIVEALDTNTAIQCALSREAPSTAKEAAIFLGTWGTMEPGNAFYYGVNHRDMDDDNLNEMVDYMGTEEYRDDMVQKARDTVAEILELHRTGTHRKMEHAVDFDDMLRIAMSEALAEATGNTPAPVDLTLEEV
ncbi:hypothetical protein RPALISO_159 [Ruegeria phage RpAliso]|nr:hypothetical protein RPALISO_159 [Ruegeria phage RpAliso]